MMTPEPTTVSNRRCGFALLIFMAWMATTLGETRSKTTVSGSLHDSAAATAGATSSVSRTSQSRMTLDHTTQPPGRPCTWPAYNRSDASPPRRDPAARLPHEPGLGAVDRPDAGRDARQRPARAAAGGSAQSDRIVPDVVPRGLA